MKTRAATIPGFSSDARRNCGGPPKKEDADLAIILPSAQRKRCHQASPIFNFGIFKALTDDNLLFLA
jgi:hypothetical protein